jgi:hypothetical protein
VQIDLDTMAILWGSFAEAQRRNGYRVKVGAASMMLHGVPLFSLFGAEVAPASA